MDKCPVCGGVLDDRGSDICPKGGVLYLDTLRSANVERQKEWDPNDDLTLAYRGNELAGEVGEACNVIKKLERERLGRRGSRATKEELADELADAMICLDLIAMQAGIDLESATREKFNKTSMKYKLHVLIRGTK